MGPLLRISEAAAARLPTCRSKLELVEVARKSNNPALLPPLQRRPLVPRFICRPAAAAARGGAAGLGNRGRHAHAQGGSFRKAGSDRDFFLGVSWLAPAAAAGLGHRLRHAHAQGGLGGKRML